METLPQGYEPRPRPAISRASLNKSWTQSQDIAWCGMLRDLWVGGRFAWQTWGGGHISSGITKALLARKMIETAEAKRGPLLFRLTIEGARIAQAWMEERGDDRVPPADSPAIYTRTRRQLGDDDRHLLVVLHDELTALLEAEDRFQVYEAEGEFYDTELRARHQRRLPELRRMIETLTYYVTPRA